jgi:hypothetical protein
VIDIILQNLIYNDLSFKKIIDELSKTLIFEIATIIARD